MKTPHPIELDPNRDRVLHPEEERLLMLGYDFLGWNPTHDNNPQLGHCMDNAHNYHSAFPNVWHVVYHTPDHSDVTQWCTKCKIYWKVNNS